MQAAVRVGLGIGVGRGWVEASVRWMSIGLEAVWAWVRLSEAELGRQYRKFRSSRDGRLAPRQLSSIGVQCPRRQVQPQL